MPSHLPHTQRCPPTCPTLAVQAYDDPNQLVQEVSGTLLQACSSAPFAALLLTSGLLELGLRLGVRGRIPGPVLVTWGCAWG